MVLHAVNSDVRSKSSLVRIYTEETSMYYFSQGPIPISFPFRRRLISAHPEECIPFSTKTVRLMSLMFIVAYKNYEEAREQLLLILVFVVNATCSLARVWCIINCAVVPVLLCLELASEVHSFQTLGEAKLDVVALHQRLVYIAIYTYDVNLLPARSCRA